MAQFLIQKHVYHFSLFFVLIPAVYNETTALTTCLHARISFFSFTQSGESCQMANEKRTCYEVNTAKESTQHEKLANSYNIANLSGLIFPFKGCRWFSQHTIERHIRKEKPSS